MGTTGCTDLRLASSFKGLVSRHVYCFFSTKALHWGTAMKRIGLILAAILGLAVQAVPASAAIQYTLNCSGNAANCNAGNNNFNFGTVTLSDLGGGNVNVSVVLASGFRFGGNNDDTFYWNTLASGNQTLSNVTS